MNKNRRNRLYGVKKRIAAILCTIEEIRDEEETAYENLPESLQESERGETMYATIEGLQDLYNNIESAAQYIDELTEY